MSLADLYRDDKELDEGSELGESEDEFVPGGAEDEGSGSDGPDDDDEQEQDEEEEEQQQEGSGDSGNDGTQASEQQKRRIDEIWQEMNAPADQRTAKQARVEEKDTEATSEDQKPKADTASSPPPPPPADDNDDDEGRRKTRPKRRASKFSKMAEMVEQRRNKRENTLDKARKEWVGFVASEGIRDDLDKANKDG
ncbi:hypothetical protein FB645_000351 [Coemansia sp. IMI 203386]|nr:hypothetical protein FB645_000351 [Coemansia sp. IMI 203386]